MTQFPNQNKLSLHASSFNPSLPPLNPSVSKTERGGRWGYEALQPFETSASIPIKPDTSSGLPVILLLKLSHMGLSKN
jgi:hypothetical protein